MIDKLTQPIGEPTRKEPMHVDNFIELHAPWSSDPGAIYAAYFLHLKRLPAGMQMAFGKWIDPLTLFCPYKGERMRCTGASRMGDVWLTSDHSQAVGYQKRVNVEDCTQWGEQA